MSSPYPDLEAVLSPARFSTYLGWAGDDRDRAIELYGLNAQLSDRIDQVLSGVSGEAWYDLPAYQANPRQPEMLSRARKDLCEAHKAETPGAVVAALTFGFWTALLGKEYEDLWQQHLHRIARRENGKGLRRKDFTRPLATLRTLRNRIAHHEPILHWDLPKHHAAMLELTGWLSPAAAEWCRAHGRFDALFPAGGIALAPSAADTP
jgi:hypothetical protein